MITFPDREAALDHIMRRIPWGNAAGTGRDGKRMTGYAQTGMPRVTFGSAMPHPWNGNDGDNVAFDDDGNGVNALGIPDKGLDAHIDDGLPEVRKAVNAAGSEFCVSISGRADGAFDPRDFYTMAKKLRQSRSADRVKGNTSCANQESGGKRKPVVCFDPPRYRDGLAALKEGAGELKTGVKIAPINDPGFLELLVGPCIEFGIDQLFFANTAGNCYVKGPDGKPAIPMVRGGRSGPWLRPLVCGGILTIAPMVKGTNLKIIGIGGIDWGRDAYEFLCLGAHGFGFNSVLTRNNYDLDVIPRIIYGDETKNQPGLLDLVMANGLPDWVDNEVTYGLAA